MVPCTQAKQARPSVVNGDTETQRKCLVLIPRAVPGHTEAPPCLPHWLGTSTMREGCVILRAGREGASRKDQLGVEANFAEFYHPLPLEREVYGEQIELMLTWSSQKDRYRHRSVCVRKCTFTSSKTAIALIFILALMQNTEPKTCTDTQK